MKDKAKVMSRYPHAVAETDKTGEWWVMSMSHNEQNRLNDKHWPEFYSRGVLGLGRTEDEAWSYAVRSIECREGCRLPVAELGEDKNSNAVDELAKLENKHD